MPEGEVGGDATIGRLRQEIGDHAEGELGMSETAREAGHDPNAVEEDPADEEVADAADAA